MLTLFFKFLALGCFWLSFITPFSFVYCLIKAIKKAIIEEDFTKEGFLAGLSLLVMVQAILLILWFS